MIWRKRQEAGEVLSSEQGYFEKTGRQFDLPLREAMLHFRDLVSADMEWVENYYNWRSRWVLMEETQYELNRIRDELDYDLVLTPEAELERERLDSFFAEQQALWARVSQRWVGFRKLAQTPQADPLSATGRRFEQ